MAEDQNFATEDEEYAAAYQERVQQSAGGETQDGGMDGDGQGGDAVVGGDGQDGDGGRDDDGQDGGAGQDGYSQGEGQGDGAPDDLEAIKKRAHSYDSLKGRHQQIQEENRVLRDELARLKQAPAPEPMAVEDVPDDLREDLEVIAGLDPELAGLVREQSADGERLRKSLARFGPESTAAMADSLRTRRYVEGQRRAETMALVERSEQERYETMLAEAPSLGKFAVTARNEQGQYQLFAQPGREAEFSAYFEGLGHWLDELPHKIARAYNETLWKTGKPREVADVLKEYDKARKPREHVDRELAENLGPVRSRSRGPGGAEGALDPDSYEGAYQRRVNQKRA